MTKERSKEKFPSFPVFGETVPKRAIFALISSGLTLAGVALWLSQDLPVQGPRSLVSDVPGGRTQSPASAASGTQGMSAESRSPTVAPLPASSPVVASNSRPKCPAPMSLHFQTGAATPLAPETPTGLDSIVNWARQHPSAKIAIEGHSDVVGVDEANLLLSYQRAKAVAALLEHRGLSAQQLQIAAAGSHGLIAGIPGDATGNRRVTIQINDADSCRPDPQ